MQRRRFPHVFYGWRIVLAGAAIFMLQALLYLYGFGVFFNPLLKSLGTSRAALGGVLGLSRLGAGLLAPAVGWLIDRYGPRRLMLVGLTLVGIGFLVFSGITSLWMLYVVFFGMALGTSLGSFAPITVTVSNWFVRKRARAQGLVSLGSAAGGSLSWALAWLIDTFGWQRSAAIAGVCYLGVAVPLASVFRHRPEQMGLLPDGVALAPPVETAVAGGADTGRPGTKADGPALAAELGEVDFTPRQALMTRAFWMLAMSFVSFSMLITVIEVYQVPFFTEDVGVSFVTAAAVTSLFPLASVPGRIIFGWLGDTLNIGCCWRGCSSRKPWVWWFSRRPKAWRGCRCTWSSLPLPSGGPSRSATPPWPATSGDGTWGPSPDCSRWWASLDRRWRRSSSGGCSTPWAATGPAS